MIKAQKLVLKTDLGFLNSQRFLVGGNSNIFVFA